MLKKLKLQNWRMFTGLEIEFQRGLNFLVGKNASGKTSIFEAIMYAFVGRVGLVDDPKLMVNKEADAASIELTFVLDEREYKIIRTISKGRKLINELYLAKNGLKPDKLENTDKKVTARIMELLGIEPAMFQRLIYLEEGDITKFISRGSGIAIRDELEKIIGLNYLRNLAKYLEKRNKSVKSRIKQLNRKIETTSTEQHVTLNEIRDQIGDLENKLSQLKGRKEKIETVFYSESQSFEKSRGVLSKLELLLTDLSIKGVSGTYLDVNYWREEVVSYNNVIFKAEKTESELEKKNLDLRAMEYNYNTDIDRIMDIKSMLESDDGSMTSCPVCLRSLDHQLTKQITHYHDNEIKNKQNELRKIERERTDIEKRLIIAKRQIKENKDRLATIQRIIDVITAPGIKITSDLSEQKFQIENIKKQKEELLKEETEVNRNINDLYRVLGRWEQINEMPKLKEQRKKLETLQHLINTLNESLDLFVEKERSGKFKELLQRIADTWNRFYGEDVGIELDKKSLPVKIHPNYNLSLREMSGGEKTILFTITRAMLSRLLCPRAGLVIIDEPLEHLDIKNRRLLLEFLYESQQKGIIDQILVATFEENLIRNYLDPLRINYIGLTVKKDKTLSISELSRQA